MFKVIGRMLLLVIQVILLIVIAREVAPVIERSEGVSGDRAIDTGKPTE